MSSRRRAARARPATPMNKAHCKLHPDAEAELGVFDVPPQTVIRLFEDAAWAVSAAATETIAARKSAAVATLRDSGFTVIDRSIPNRVVFTREVEYRPAGNGVVRRRFTFLGDLKQNALVLIGLTPNNAPDADSARLRSRITALRPA